MTQQPMTLEQILAKVNQRIASLEELQRDLSEDGKYGWLRGVDAYIYAPSQHVQEEMLGVYGLLTDYDHPEVHTFFTNYPDEGTAADKTLVAELNYFRGLKIEIEEKLAEIGQAEADYQAAVKKIEATIEDFVNKHCLDPMGRVIDGANPEMYKRLCNVRHIL
jgi:hypothetical protein